MIFIRLNQNYQDYIRDLNSVRAEEMMHTKEFLVFKDRLIEYLRSFIKGLQRNVGVIEENLRLQSEELKKQVFEKVIDYELSIPRMEIEISKELIEQKVQDDIRASMTGSWEMKDRRMKRENFLMPPMISSEGLQDTLHS